MRHCTEFLYINHRENEFHVTIISKLEQIIIGYQLFRLRLFKIIEEIVFDCV